MCTGVELALLATAVVGTGTQLYAQDTQAKQGEANAKFAADQAAADAAAEQGAAQVEAERIRKAGKKQQSAAIAAAAASGVDVNSGTAVKIDQEIGKNAGEDAYLTLVGGRDAGARLNQQGAADRIAGSNIRSAGRTQQGATLISAAGGAGTNYGKGWKKAANSGGT